MPFVSKYTDLDVTLRPTFRKDFRKKVDEDAINQHLKFLILTEQDDIPFENNISADVRNLLFQPYSRPVQEALTSVIKNIVKQYEKRITLGEVSNTLIGNDVTVSITYTINQTRIVGNFKTILKRVH